MICLGVAAACTGAAVVAGSRRPESQVLGSVLYATGILAIWRDLARMLLSGKPKPVSDSDRFLSIRTVRRPWGEDAVFLADAIGEEAVEIPMTVEIFRAMNQ